ncbi:50S ribosomal protein L29 [Patescibacteria group bacterium]|nr:50S ribosomal protein L29 [Patescibacteria group bacterium]
MKKNDLNSLRAKTVAELRKEAAKRQVELSSFYAKIKAGQEKNLKRAKNARRDLAQILTLIRQKELLEQRAENKEHRKREETEKSP